MRRDLDFSCVHTRAGNNRKKEKLALMLGNEGHVPGYEKKKN